ncbi:hypothetical protein G5B39_14535 (plasmid) [Rhodobacteraceae bacterium SC52]|nr:hypothetical protein G5B39_14535 [Rhodobacteraceae bacterium SC52]
MSGNLGQTRLKRRRKCTDPMKDYDRLPPELRGWLATAILPWSPRSVRRAFKRAKAEYGDVQIALAELDRLEARLIARDAKHVWLGLHPIVQVEGRT